MPEMTLPHRYIDAHHHLWAPVSRGDEIGYGWLRDIGAPKPFGDPTPIQRDYLIEEFVAECGLRPAASVHVQTDGSLSDPVAETAFVSNEAKRGSLPVAIVGLADLSSDDLADTLKRHMAHDGFVGVRQIVARLAHRPDLSFAPRDFLGDPAWRNGLKMIADQGLTFDLQMYPEQVEPALDALSSTPDLTVIIDHALCPYFTPASGSDPESVNAFDDPTNPAYPSVIDFDLWKRAVTMMAARENTYVKLSGWGMYDARWTANSSASIKAYVSHILEEFGAERLMWGSNYPVEKLAQSYENTLSGNAITLPAEVWGDVFCQTASMAYGLKLT